PLQRARGERDGLQWGYCTPGQVKAATGPGPDGSFGATGCCVCWVGMAPLVHAMFWLRRNRLLGSSASTQDEGGDLLRLVDLDVVPGAVQQVQLAVGEQRGEVPGNPRVEVAVAGTEDHPDGPAEAAQLAHGPPAGEHRGEQVVVEAPERRAGSDCAYSCGTSWSRTAGSWMNPRVPMVSRNPATMNRRCPGSTVAGGSGPPGGRSGGGAKAASRTGPGPRAGSAGPAPQTRATPAAPARGTSD